MLVGETSPNNISRHNSEPKYAIGPMSIIYVRDISPQIKNLLTFIDNPNYKSVAPVYLQQAIPYPYRGLFKSHVYW